MHENSTKTLTPPKFTIVVAVYHSLSYLGQCLASLAALDFPRWDYRVVTLDLGVIDGVSSLVNEVSDGDAALELVNLPNESPHTSALQAEMSLSRLRNEAIDKFPSQNYVFTEDDCTYSPNWLRKIDAALSDRVGVVGGPDLLPFDIGWLATTLDCILNAPLGRAGAKPGKGKPSGWYFPHKENMAVPARVFEQVGKFAEHRFYGAEMEITQRIRAAALTVVYLPANPVWHKRWTTLPKLLLRNILMGSEKVHMMRERGYFYQSQHFLVLLAAVILALMGLAAPFSPVIFLALLFIVAMYVSYLVYVAAFSAARSGKKWIGLAAFLLTPIHQLTVFMGILRGMVTKPRSGAS